MESRSPFKSASRLVSTSTEIWSSVSAGLRPSYFLDRKTLSRTVGLVPHATGLTLLLAALRMMQNHLAKLAELCGFFCSPCSWRAAVVLRLVSFVAEEEELGPGAMQLRPRSSACSSRILPGADSGQPYPIFDGPGGSYRAFGGSCAAFWVGMDNGPSASPQYDFSGLDTLLLTLKARGIDEVLITLGRTPNYISSDPTDLECDGSTRARQDSAILRPMWMR